VEGRYDSRPLAVAVTVTGMLATMPYIALQLVGMQVVLEVMGLGVGSDSWLVKDVPLFVAFAELAAYTYSSGLRAPALIAFVKDPPLRRHSRRGVLPAVPAGWVGRHLHSRRREFRLLQRRERRRHRRRRRRRPASMPPGPAQWAYASLALGAALALFMYPHSVTAVLPTRRRSVIRRNAALLPAFTLLLGLVALLGFVAIAAGVQVENPQQAVPQLFENEFSPLVTGVAFAAIVIGALVPAAIMAIAAANLWSRNIYRAFLNRRATPAQEARQSKVASLLVKFGALAFVLALSNQFAINLQLLGSVWILQTLPAIVIGLYTRWMHRWARFAGWAAGMVWGTWLAYGVASPTPEHFGGPLVDFPGTDTRVYIGLVAFLVNLLVAVVLTVLFRAIKVEEGVDRTRPSDYVADAGDDGPPEPNQPVQA
jgi:SSS family solute:Na+ symporter